MIRPSRRLRVNCRARPSRGSAGPAIRVMFGVSRDSEALAGPFARAHTQVVMRIRSVIRRTVRAGWAGPLGRENAGFRTHARAHAHARGKGHVRTPAWSIDMG